MELPLEFYHESYHSIYCCTRSTKILVDGALRIEVHKVLSIKLKQPRGLSNLYARWNMILSCTWWSTAGALPISAELLLRVSHVEFLSFPFPVKGSAIKELHGLTVFLVDL